MIRDEYVLRNTQYGLHFSEVKLTKNKIDIKIRYLSKLGIFIEYSLWINGVYIPESLELDMRKDIYDRLETFRREETINKILYGENIGL